MRNFIASHSRYVAIRGYIDCHWIRSTLDRMKFVRRSFGGSRSKLHFGRDIRWTLARFPLSLSLLFSIVLMADNHKALLERLITNQGPFNGSHETHWPFNAEDTTRHAGRLTGLRANFLVRPFVLHNTRRQTFRDEYLRIFPKCQKWCPNVSSFNTLAIVTYVSPMIR